MYRVTVSISKEQKEMLEFLSKKKEISISEIVRNFISSEIHSELVKHNYSYTNKKSEYIIDSEETTLI